MNCDEELDTEAADHCPSCGVDWLEDGETVYGCDIRIGTGEQYLTWRACCEGHASAVDAWGFEAAYGVSVVDVANYIAPGVEVVEILGHGDGTVLAKLKTVDPAVLVAGEGRRAKSPKGWRAEVFAEVTEHHRHHAAPQGHKFSIAVHNGFVRVGVAVIGRPVSRLLQQAEPDTLEVTRVATWGRSDLRFNASSKLYSAAGKRARALGFTKLVTYTLDEESGVSLRASGFVMTRRSSGGSWNRSSRTRTDKAPTGAKSRWERGLTKSARREVEARAVEFEKNDATEQKTSDSGQSVLRFSVSAGVGGKGREGKRNERIKAGVRGRVVRARGGDGGEALRSVAVP